MGGIAKEDPSLLRRSRCAWTDVNMLQHGRYSFVDSSRSKRSPPLGLPCALRDLALLHPTPSPTHDLAGRRGMYLLAMTTLSPRKLTLCSDPHTAAWQVPVGNARSCGASVRLAPRLLGV